MSKFGNGFGNGYGNGHTVPEQPAGRMSPIETTIVIPAYNEEQAIPRVLEAIFSIVDERYEVLVINDGSSDNTRTAASAFPCRIITHLTNSGKGAAMQTGIRHAQGEKIIFIDGDATYPVTAIPEIVRQLDHYDLVRCVRSEGRDNIPLFNRIGNEIFDHLIKSIHNVKGNDVLSGLYGLRSSHLKAMRLTAQGFDIETEIMVKAQAMHLQMYPLPISYNERIGEKKLKPVRDGMTILKRIVHLALMLNPFLAYVLPGTVLWVISICALVILANGPIFMPFGGLSTNTMIVSAMAFLSGFQLIVFGCLVNLYTVEAGLSKPSNPLNKIATRSNRLGGALLGTLLAAAGTVWALALFWAWVASGFGAFTQTEALVIALALVVWGVQLLSTMLLLSLFAGLNRFAPVPYTTDIGRPRTPSVLPMTRIPVLMSTYEEPIERAVGEK